MNPVHFVHRHHHGTAVGGNDQHPRHDPHTIGHAADAIESQQLDQGKARHQRTAHIRHAEQGPGALMGQGVNGLQRRHFHQTACGQPKPFFAEAKHQ
ncbi:hypothetical protein D3C80_1871110 [compost metagenome]